MENTGVLILTVRIDDRSQQFFNELRITHFPPERNFLQAHLTLFHQLPDQPATIAILNDFTAHSFRMDVTKLINLGAGVAYRIEAEQLSHLRENLVQLFSKDLIPQDKQGFRGHITVQNKTTPEQARALLAALSEGFQPFQIRALGLDLWNYLGGPWSHQQYFPFQTPEQDISG
jgi:2'-5' RNA ligase